MNFWKKIKIFFFGRLSLTEKEICEYSKKGKRDYHDYPDDINGEPWHMVDLQCKRCGKLFQI